MNSPEAVIADVRVSETLDALYLRPRALGEGVDVMQALRSAFPNARNFKRSADGVRIPSSLTPALVSDIAGLELKWTGEAHRFVENRQRTARSLQRLRSELRGLKDAGPGNARHLIKDSAGLDILDPHQVLNVAAMTLDEGLGLCVFDEQGTGKTVTLIYAFDLLVARDQADIAIIVAPKSMVPEWPKDFERFRSDLYHVQVVTGTRREKRTALHSGADVFVTNFETAVSLEDEFKALARSKLGRTILVVDESFFIKSLDAKRTRALRRVREWCGRAFVLCGTPAPNAPQDLVQQFNLVDFGLTFQDVDIPDDRGAAAPVVQEAIDARGLYVRHLKSDVLPELPEKRFQRLFVPLEPVQRQVYEAALRDLILNLEAVTDEEFQRRIPNFLARRAALLQICSNPVAVANGYSETPAKLVALDGLLADLVERRHEKVVLWSYYTASVSSIVERYSNYGTLRYDGLVSDVAERSEAVRRFQEDDDAMVFVANPAAAGAGLTLHRARIAVYESLSNQAAHYLQSLDRIHRRGQMRDVEYVVLLCDGTLEIQEYDRLVQKEAAAQQLLGDKVTPPATREAFLADAREAANLLARAAR